LAILKAIKNRLLNEKIKVGCLSCKKVWGRKVNKIDNTCPICASIKITFFNGYEKDNIKAFKKGKTTSKLKKELIKRSHILRWHGLRGGMALAGRGIGSETAVRILEVPYKDELDFIKAIFRAEITYAKNRQFWNKR